MVVQLSFIVFEKKMGLVLEQGLNIILSFPYFISHYFLQRISQMNLKKANVLV